MDKYLRPERFDADPNMTGADKRYKHWIKTFENFLNSIELTPVTNVDGTSTERAVDKLSTLMNYISSNVFEFIADCTTYEESIEILQSLYIKPTNEIYARYSLATRKQADGESLDTYLQELKHLSKSCNFTAVTAEQHCQMYIRDAFISGIKSRAIRQRLLENLTLTLSSAFEQARSLEMAQKSAEAYSTPTLLNATHATNDGSNKDIPMKEETDQMLAATGIQRCNNCGNGRHPRRFCPAKDSTCNRCGKIGHWKCVCRSTTHYDRNNDRNGRQNKQSAAIWPTLATLQCVDNQTTNGFCKITIKGKEVSALLDSGSITCSFISKMLVERLSLPVYPSKGKVSMANSTLSSKILGHCLIEFELDSRIYHEMKVI